MGRSAFVPIPLRKQQGLGIFLGFVALLLNLFWMVTLFNPVTDHSYGRVLAHSIPYLGLQTAYLFFMTFLLLKLPPETYCRKMTFRIATVVYLLMQIFQFVIIAWTFMEYAAHWAEPEGNFQGPARQISAVTEPTSLLCRLVALFGHGLNTRTAPSSTDAEKVEKDVEAAS